MKLKLDENLSRCLKRILVGFQHDVTTAGEEDLLSQPDTAVAHAAKHEARMLFTLDTEFGDLRKYPPGNHPGIVLFRPRSLGPLAVNEFVRGFVAATDLRRLEGCVVVVEPSRVRVRRPPPSAAQSLPSRG